MNTENISNEAEKNALNKGDVMPCFVYYTDTFSGSERIGLAKFFMGDDVMVRRNSYASDFYNYKDLVKVDINKA